MQPIEHQHQRHRPVTDLSGRFEISRTLVYDTAIYKKYNTARSKNL